MRQRALSLYLLPVLWWACGGGASPEPAPAPATPARSDAATEQKLRDGVQEILHPNGRVKMIGPLKDGQRHGIWLAYFPDGTLQSRGAYVNGQRHGVAEVFHENGERYFLGQYHHDNPSGEWQFFDSTGTLRRTVRYDTLGNILDRR